jgi:putative hydrolase of the HAD superfamily
MRLVVVDVDDTLYLERDYVRSGFDAVAVELGNPAFAEACWALFAEGVRGDTFERAARAIGLQPTPELTARAVACYRGHEPTIRLLPDARAFLERSAGTAFLGVVTDGPAASQRAKVSALGLPAIVDRIIVTDELGPGMGKPHPRAFELLEAAAATGGSACVYIADNPRKDFVAPRALGWSTVRVRRPGGLHAAVPSGTDVDEEVATLDGLAFA